MSLMNLASVLGKKTQKKRFVSLNVITQVSKYLIKFKKFLKSNEPNKGPINNNKTYRKIAGMRFEK